MKIKKAQNKLWKIRNDKRKNKIRIKRKKKKINRKTVHNKGIVSQKNEIPCVVTENFSIVNNPNETVEFFNKIIDTIKKTDLLINKKKSYKIRIIMKDTKKITIDALIYLLAIIKNTKLRYCNIFWTGDLPLENDLAIFVKNSGFLNFVKSNVKILDYDKNNIQIKSGELCDPKLSSNICDFVKNKTKNEFATSKLQKILIELMSNVKKHAYTSIENMEIKWYIFVEDKLDTLQFTFVDTGLGIPKTVSKKPLEIINIKKLDSEYIYSTFKIDSGRTRTNKKYRGSGLPFIKDCENTNYISKLTIISNGGFFRESDKFDLDNKIKGTVFYWELQKGVNND